MSGELLPEEASSNRIHDRLADGYGYNTEATTASRLKSRLVCQLLDPSARVLDVGCANAIHLRLVAPLCATAVGIDINERMLELARTKLNSDGITNARLERQSAMKLRFEDGAFDVVYSFSTLLLVPDIERALSEMGRVLRPGGLLVVDIAGRFNLSQLAWRIWYRRQGHARLNAVSYRTLRRMLSAHGLTVVSAHATGFCDQWKYIPVLRKVRKLDTWFHGAEDPDLDARVSRHPLFFPLANRWYVVAVKSA